MRGSIRHTCHRLTFKKVEKGYSLQRVGLNRTFKTTCAFKEQTDCIELGTSKVGKCCRFITAKLFETYYTFHKGVKWKQNQTCLLVASTFVKRGGFFLYV